MKKRFAICMILFASVAALVIIKTSQAAAQEASASTAEKPVDYEFFKTRVEPIFLKKRPGLTRCYVCHVTRFDNETAFRLEKLQPGNTFWTEEQSRTNFELVSQLVTPGEPLKSYLLMHPMQRKVGEAGGPAFHGGGRQFASQNDPDWLILAEWVRGQKAGGSREK
jgi:hypothetical protein